MRSLTIMAILLTVGAFIAIARGNVMSPFALVLSATAITMWLVTLLMNLRK